MGGAIQIDELIRSTKPQVVALEVCARAIGTRGEPPRARVRILEVLHGSLTPGEHDALFAPDNQESWYAIREGGDEGLARWKATPCSSPETGARLIVAANLGTEGTLVVWARSIRADSKAERARLRALLAEGT